MWLLTELSSLLGWLLDLPDPGLGIEHLGTHTSGYQLAGFSSTNT